MKLSVRNLNFSYQDQKVIRDLSFDVEDGELSVSWGPPAAENRPC